METGQLNLFTTDKTCVYCNHGERSHRNPYLFDGFLDGDTKELVCSRCKTLHYIKKGIDMGTIEWEGEPWKSRYRFSGGMLYSETPVVL